MRAGQGRGEREAAGCVWGGLVLRLRVDSGRRGGRPARAHWRSVSPFARGGRQPVSGGCGSGSGSFCLRRWPSASAARPAGERRPAGSCRAGAVGSDSRSGTSRGSGGGLGWADLIRSGDPLGMVGPKRVLKDPLARPVSAGPCRGAAGVRCGGAAASPACPAAGLRPLPGRDGHLRQYESFQLRQLRWGARPGGARLPGG